MKFSPAPYYLLVVPELETGTIGGLRIEAPQNSTTTGTVVAIGQRPWRYRKIKVGSRILFARSVTTAATITNQDGEEIECVAISLADYRGLYVLPKKKTGRNLLGWIPGVGLSTIAAALAGYALGHVWRPGLVDAIRALLSRRRP